MTTQKRAKLPQIAVVGLGHMGGAIAARLVASGFHVKGYDLSPLAMKAAEAAGVSVANSAQTAAAGADILLTSLSTPGALRAVLTEDDGVIAVMRSGSAIIESSTVGPSTAKEMARIAESYGVGYLDAPVTRGPDAARAGQLSVLVGGNATLIDRCLPVLQSIGSSIFHVGPVGTGQVAKLANNILSAVIIAATAEAIVFGQKAGLNRDTLVEAISSSSGSSYVLEHFFPRAFAGDFEPGGSLDITHKDLDLILKEGTGASPLFLSAMTREIVSLAKTKNFGHLDTTALLLLYGDLAGVAQPRGKIE